MEQLNKTSVTVETSVNAPAEKVWKLWTGAEHVMQWNNASDDWHTPHAENDLRKDGKFKYTMAAKDGSMSFDFEGVYTKVEELKKIEYTMPDGRKVSITFTAEGDGTHVSEAFDVDNEHPIDIQRSGWQAILDNFKKYTESH